MFFHLKGLQGVSVSEMLRCHQQLESVFGTVASPGVLSWDVILLCLAQGWYWPQRGKKHRGIMGSCLCYLDIFLLHCEALWVQLWLSECSPYLCYSFPAVILCLQWVTLYLLGFYILCFTQGIKGGKDSFAIEGNIPSSHQINPYSPSLRRFSSGGRARRATEESGAAKLLPQAQSSFSNLHMAEPVCVSTAMLTKNCRAGLFSSSLSPGFLWTPVWSLVK